MGRHKWPRNPALITLSVPHVPKWLLTRKSRYDQKEEEYGLKERTKETNDELWNIPRNVEDASK